RKPHRPDAALHRIPAPGPAGPPAHLPARRLLGLQDPPPRRRRKRKRRRDPGRHLIQQHHGGSPADWPADPASRPSNRPNPAHPPAAGSAAVAVVAERVMVLVLPVYRNRRYSMGKIPNPPVDRSFVI